MKDVIITILTILVLVLGGYLIYDKVIVKEVKENCTEEKTEENKYTYEEIAGNYYYEIDAGLVEMPGLMDRFYLLLSEDGTFSYSHRRDTSGGVIGNYMINGNIITLNYIATTGNDAGIGEILDKYHTLIINEDKSITDEKVELGTIFTSKITLIRDGKPGQVGSDFYTFDQILQQQLNITSFNY